MAKTTDTPLNEQKRPKSRVARLVNIIVLLGIKGSLTAEELSEKLKVTKRTVYRDVEALNSWGLKIKSSAGVGGGYQLPPEIKMNLSALTASEISFIGAGSLAIKDFIDLHEDVYNFEITKEKLSSGLPPSLKPVFDKYNSCFYFDPSRWYKKYTLSNHLKLLRDAVIDDFQINISYKEINNNERNDSINPYGLVYKSDTWYLVGLSQSDKTIKRWNVTRLNTLEKLNTNFKRPEGFSLKEWWTNELEEFGKGNVKVSLKISKDAMHRFSRFQWKANNKFYDNDNSIIVELMVDNYNWLIDIVLVSQGKVTVIEPEDLKSKIQNIASTINISHSFPDSPLIDNKKTINISDLEALSLSEGKGDE
ncbi:MAG: hypothetical protein POELPBGB_01420 [Bacteroidia bacterium]|nr:hypothetical protein [Bacteroidia bacterium]